MDIKRFSITIARNTEQKLAEVINKGELASGFAIPEFERELASLSQNKFAVATSNGFSALHLALEVLELKNKKIIMPALSSCMAISNAIKASGNEALFVDVEESSPNMNATAINDIGNAGAIISPNYFGVLSNVKEMRKAGLPIIEDCAQSAGTQFYGNISQNSDLKIFSFYPTKIINAIDGGMVTTDDPILKQKVIARRYYGGVRKDDGIQRFNYKISNVNAVFGLAQLHQLQEICSRRREIASKYIEAIGDTQFLQGDSRSDVYQKFILKFENKERRDLCMQKLNEEGIPSCSELNPMTSNGDLFWISECNGLVAKPLFSSDL